MSVASTSSHGYGSSTKDDSASTNLTSRTMDPYPIIFLDEKTGSTIRATVKTISPKVVYLACLRESGNYFDVNRRHALIADFDKEKGDLSTSYRVIHKQHFVGGTDAQGQHQQGYIFSCECDEGAAKHYRLLQTYSHLAEDLLEFYYREGDANHCIHTYAVDQLMPMSITPFNPQDTDDEEEGDSDGVHQLSADPLLVAVTVKNDLYIITYNRRSSKNVCSCHTTTRSCQHLKAYKEWRGDGDGEEGEDEVVPNINPSYESISSDSIPYPLPDNLREVYRQYGMSMRKFPYNLIPDISNSNQTCEHGFPWDERDPVERGWLCGNATIFTDSMSITHVFQDEIYHPVRVYYRRSNGQCQCKLMYDGQQDLLFNLNNKDLVYYGLLFKYMHFMLEARNPLAACHRALKHNYATLSGTECIAVHKLRKAWNAFGRLVDIDWEASFTCPVCGTCPSVVICDGTTLGFKKSYLAAFEDIPESSDLPQIQGSVHQHRVIVNNQKARQLLIVYGKGLTPLSHEQFTMLVSLLWASVPAVAELLLFLHAPVQLTFAAPASHKELILNLAFNSPAIALLQGTSQQDINIVKTYLSTLDVMASENHQALEYIQRAMPVLASILPKPLDKLSVNLLLVVLKKAIAAYPPVSPNVYPPPQEEQMFESLSFFPNLKQVHGPGRYAKNDKSRNAACRTGDDECRKFSRGHPTLSPGIFTLFCEHGICLGFESMKSHESPKVPFTMFTTRFAKAPSIIVYDNACHLHQYCLNREPNFFRDTIFVIDRMHQYNHRACSKGYKMDVYHGRIDIKRINSQVNEQANAGLARIKGQLAYMLPGNFTFHAALFLSLKNFHKKKKL